MKLTKKLKAEVLKFYKSYWDTYLNGDMKTLASMLDDNVTVVGTAVSEVFNNKKKTLKFYKATADQLVGKAQFRNRKIDLSAVDDTILIKEQCDFYVLLERKWTYYGHVRVTAIVKKTNKGLKLVQQHASFPDMKADEGEQLAAEKIKEENLQLRDAVKRRTIELEEKNQELEIEAALERVRTVAMSMRSSNELVSVCKVMNEELIKLGFTNIRNSQIAINNDDKQLYVNYEYSAYDGESITDVAYNSHRRVKAMVKKMKESKDAFFSVKITGKELNEWRRFRIKLGQKKDEKLAKAKAVCYYFYSVGNGALGISTFNAINKEQQLLLQKFRNVFVLAYKRFTDIQKAEAQAREAQIEAALERVRSRTMAMYRSQEIADIVGKIFTELKFLDLVLNRVLIWIFNNDERYISWWSANPEKETNAESYRVDYNDQPIFLSYLQAWQKRLPLHLYMLSGDNKKRWEDHLFTSTELSKLPAAVRKGMREEGTIFTTSTIGDYGLMMVGSFEPLSIENTDIIQRFGRVFQQSYTRYLDVQKAEAQAREAQIEAALERIRSVSMAMRTSNELFDIIRTVFGEWKKLGLELYECNINLLDREKKEWTNWGTGIGEAALPRSFLFPCFDDPFVNQLYEDTCKGISSRTYRIEGKAHRRFLDGMFAKTDFKNAPVEYREALYSIHRLYLTHAFMQYGSMDIVGPEAPPESTIEILKRFAKVFEQAYTRYLDVIKAEVQAREAQIELGLERVRARAMAMQKSDELRQVVTVLFQQIKSLGFDAFMSTIILFDKRTRNYDCLMASNVQSELPHIYHVPYFENRFMKIFTGAFSEEVPYKVLELSGQDKEDYDRYLLTKTDFKKLPDETKQMMKSVKACQLCCAYMAYGCIEAIGNEPLNNNDAFTLQRFAKVFEQTYTRFLDLQKAEEQTREAQIELGLERVRARAMAMQNSDELKELIGAVFIELTKLDLVLTRCLIMIFDPKTNGSTWWMANSEAPSDPIGLYIKYHEHSPYAAYINAWQERKNKWQYILEGKDKKEWDEFLFVETELSQLPEFVIAGMKAPDRVYLSCSFNNFGCLNLASLEPLSDEHFDILLRFAKVFDLTYTRFNDLKQAEAQAKEAKIQLALERVRARTMAMQRSDELSETSFVLFEQFKKLGLTADQISIGIIKEEEGYIEMSATVHGNQLQQIIKISLDEPFAIKKMLRAWKDKERSLVINIQGNELEQYNIYRNKISGTSLFPEKANEQDHWIINAAFFSKGFLSFSTYEPQPNETIELLERFASVFDLTYTRFLDLKQAEAQAKESQIQLALERVRARTMAMQHSNELSETASLLFDQLKSLGEIPERTFIGVFNESEWVIEIWATQHGGSQMDMLVKATIDEPHVMNRMYKAWKEQKKSIVIDLKGEELESYFQFLKAKGAPVKREIFGDRRLENIAFFSKGMLGIITTEPATTESIQLYERFANAFDLTYTRFLDLKKAEAQAREAQIETALERVRSKTMAMQRSEELDSVIKTVYSELKHLDVSFARCFIMIFDEQKGATWWMGSPDDDLFHEGFYVQYHTHPPHLAYLKGWEERQQKWEYRLEGQIKKNWDEFVFNQTGLSKLPPIVIQDMKSFEFAQLSASFENFGCMTTGGPERLSEKSFDILSRFAKVFDQTYTRFNDLKNAEAQAREAQIEAALERVRSRAMAMHKTDELLNAAELVSKELSALGIESMNVSYAFVDENEKYASYYSLNPVDGKIPPLPFVFPHDETDVMRSILSSWKKQEPFNVIELDEEATLKHQTWVGEHIQNLLTKNNIDIQFSVEEFLTVSPKKAVIYSFNFAKGYLFNIGGQRLTKAQEEMLLRFTKVFDLAYRRFLDLKQAEAQARESQIELALERVRARTMAMHRSEELAETAQVMFHQLQELGAIPDRIAIGVVDETAAVVNFWSTDQAGSHLDKGFKARLNEKTVIAKTYQAWKENRKSIVIDLHGDDLKEWIQFAREEMGIVVKDEHIKDRRIHNLAFFSHGWILVTSHEPQSAETVQILERFASVFNLTYRRFLDLEKAEAQAREAQIEAALERVRAKAMAMHKSDDLHGAVTIMFEEFQKLNLDVLRCGIGILDKDSRSGAVWATSVSDNGLAVQISANESFDTHPLMMLIYEFWQKQEDLDYVLQGQDLISYYKTMEASELKLPESQLFLSEDELQSQYYYAAMFNAGGLYAFRDKPFASEDKKIMKRFASVVNLTYNRFLDLQKAEAQARESELELALERVRARSMSMRHSDELADLVKIVFKELTRIGFPVNGCIIMTYDERTNDSTWWIANVEGVSNPVGLLVPYHSHKPYLAYLNEWKKQTTKWRYKLGGSEKKKWDQYVFKNSELATLPDVIKKGMQSVEDVHLNVCFNKYASITFGSIGPMSDKDFDTVHRFAKVFEQSYTRFLDLQKAEANAREAQIEAGLERVRARTMAMHSSDDVSIATATMFTELEKLGIEYLRGGITNIMANRTQEVWSVNNVAEGKIVKAVGTFQIDDHPFWQLMYKDWQDKKEFLYYYLAGTEKENYIKILSTAQNYLPQILQQFPDVHFHVYFFGEGALWTNSLKPHTEEEKQIMKRFTSVFSLTFRRYQDLKKAEAQAREAQIEAALEKVRASTMAMQKSEDLSQAAFVLFKQFKELGESPERIFIATFDSADENLVDLWGTNQGGNQLDKLFRVSANEPTVIKKIVDAWKEKKSSVVIDLTGADLKNYLQFLESTGIPVTYGVMTERRVQTVACFSKGVIGVTTPEPRPAASIQLLERFANVFDLTYTRFLDLLQAEAQAREATIEAALEKVRGKAMAMHNSDDLSVTTSMIITELRRLGINPIRCGVGIIDKETHKGQLYTATTSPEGDNLSVVGWVLLQGHHVLESIYQKWVDGEDYFPELTGESMRHYYEQLLAGLSVPLPDFSDEQKHYGHFFAVSVGCLYAWSDKKYNDDEIKILKRFATIIDLTFRRYFELQKSEANAREAVKQAALDRVRADIASMRTVNDLDRITPLIWNELTILGIPFIRCGVFIMDESQQLIHTFLSTPDGKAIAAFHLPYDTPGNISKVIDGWRHKKIYVDHWGEEEFVQFADILMKQGALISRENYLKTIPQRGFHLHFLPFLQGMLYVGNTEKLNEEEIELIQHLADAFSTAYARYEDFNKLEAAKQQVERTLTDLKQAQQQLVQSEKMASLGELTAGIAHEIQNPLNFVNNFSDVSNELLEEMKIELEKGNKDDAIAIVEDVKQNLEKILHHGKRADAIVKGMLQHSRTSSGQKELTDINALTDEYLRLAFHGLRAKDKTFNAKFETHFDNSIEKINIIPQDIGRVILNLINNAFYTVTEKKKQNQNGYEPTVTVTTLKDNGKIEIKVRDNGNGIPQKVLDKIFQPFFTTKPTGQGTGLGLSLAYDIVTKGHGGELKVETKEGDGSEFIIQLPTN